MWAPEPIEVKLYSTDQAWLEEHAPEVAARLEQMPGVVDVFDGLVYTGPTISLRTRPADARRFGLTADDVADAANTAMLGQTASSVLEGDRVVDVRVKVDSTRLLKMSQVEDLPIRTPTGTLVKLSQVVDVVQEPGQLELRREDGRQDVAVTARLEGRDMGSAMAEIRQALGADASLPPGTVEYGGLYQQQRESFRNLVFVLLMAITLVFTVLLLEFGSFYEPVSIVFGAVLALFGTVLALWLTGTSFNVVSFLGAIIGIGIVAKNGILMLDFVRVPACRGTGPGGGARPLGTPAPAPGAHDLAGRGAGHAAARLGHRLGRRHAQAPGHRGHRRAGHLGAPLAAGHTHPLLPAPAPPGQGAPESIGGDVMNRAWFLSALSPLLVVAACGSPAQRAAQEAVPTYHPVTEIAIGGDAGFWDYLSEDPVARRLYVTNGTRVVVIDMDADSVVGEIPDLPGRARLRGGPRPG